jgi:predicted MFS family arabinose efflux permease
MVQLEGTGVALANAAAPFLPVFLARLGASNFQVGLLSAMPAFTGLLLSVAVGGWLLSQPSAAPWYGRARFFSILAYGLTGLVTLLLPPSYSVPAVLVIWALATLPAVVVNITFSVVMNAVAGPKLRYDLLGRRWSMMGLITAVCIALTGQVLQHLRFPFNYQIAFMCLSVGGLVSLFFSERVRLPSATTQNRPASSPREQWRAMVGLLRAEPAFVSIAGKRFLYMAGVALAVPIVPLYYVRVAHASDAAIGLITTVQTLTLLIGYRLWTRLSQRRGSRPVLLLTTLALAAYPALAAATQQVGVLALLAGLAGIFQAGFDLVFFDELMKRVPAGQAPLFVSFDQSAQNLAAVAAPLIGTLLADRLGLGGALLVSAGLRLIAFILFARGSATPEAAAV